ncbi:MAG: hypothetical protein IMZ61_09235 [Planctomycetes bacterium]|nr:hypothetical protein [Planctomycetota bacterium]
MKMIRICTAGLAIFSLLLIGGCSQMQNKSATFGQDIEFLKKHTRIIVLSDKSGDAQVAVVPAYQGRVMTSTADGAKGLSFGWINRELIASGEKRQHINAYGGEERFWMGPEGGQFAVYFPKGAPFDFEHWQVPAVIDTEPFELVSQASDQAIFRRKASLTNWSGTVFDIQIDRTIRLLKPEEANKKLGAAVGGSVKMVAYETESTITNTGTQPWKKETGLLSIWILSMFSPSPETTIVIPFNAGAEATLGPKVNDEYFGKVPADRLAVKDSVLFFKGDGKYRSKIGLSPKRAKPISGSYDATNTVLTLVQYTKPDGANDYVNSMWQQQEKPYAGDVANSYNDGPAEPGKKPMGPFYELESSSPALELGPNKSGSHIHRVFHLVGPESELDKIARATLGVKLEEIKSAL